MANASILAAFERMWQHVVAALGNKADVSDVTDLQNQIDSKANVEHGHDYSEIENVPVGDQFGDTLIWDHDKLVLMLIDTDLYANNFSDIVLNYDDFSNGYTLFGTFKGENYRSVFVNANGVFKRTEDGLIEIQFFANGQKISIYVVPYDNYTYGTTVFPKKGLCTTTTHGGITINITIPNYTGFPTTKKLDVKYLPDAISPSVELTQAEYDALELAGGTDPETVYYITDADPEGGSGSGASSADKVSYDNSVSGLEATDLQGAVDEVTAEIDEIKQSFQDGCDTIAGECTTCGVSPASNSPDDIVNAIKQIHTERYNAGVTDTKKGTAVVADVLTGKTFTNSSGVGLSGSMTNRGAWTGATTGSGNVTIPAGYHNGSGYVSGKGAYDAGVAAGKASATVTVEEKTVSFSQSYKESEYTQTFSKTATFSKTPKYVYIKSVSQNHSESIWDMDVAAPTFSGTTATVKVTAHVPAYRTFSMSVVLVAIMA